MSDFLYSIDVVIFNFINGTLSNPVFDKFFPFITNIQHWIIAYIFLWFILLLNGGKKGKIVAISLIFLIAITDQISSNLLKNFFGRIRPCHVLENINILIGCSKTFSFPSSHAVNNFSVAVFLYKFYPKFKWIFFTIAALMALSRVVVGVHYPSDIFAGAVIGSIIGYIFAQIILNITKKLNEEYEN